MVFVTQHKSSNLQSCEEKPSRRLFFKVYVYNLRSSGDVKNSIYPRPKHRLYVKK